MYVPRSSGTLDGSQLMMFQWRNLTPVYLSVQGVLIENTTSHSQALQSVLSIATTGGLLPHFPNICPWQHPTYLHLQPSEPYIYSRTLYRSKLSKNKSISFPPSLSTAIASMTEGFSFAYLKEAFIAALLVLVAAQRAVKSGTKPEERLSNNVPTPTPGSDTDLENNQLWQVLSKQVQTLRTEMEESRKSAEDAAENNANANGAVAEAEDGGCKGCVDY